MSHLSFLGHIRTNVNMGLVPLKDGREPSVLGSVSTEDLLDWIDALLLPYGDSTSPYEGCYPSCETRHLWIQADLASYGMESPGDESNGQAIERRAGAVQRHSTTFKSFLAADLQS